MSINYSSIQDLGYARLKMSIPVPSLCPMLLKKILHSDPQNTGLLIT